MEEQYSQKEENTFRKELFRRMDNQDTDLKEIKIQTLKTNGRVNKHDWYFKAMWWVLGTVVALSVPILNLIKWEIRSTVVGVLSDYDINQTR